MAEALTLNQPTQRHNKKTEWNMDKIIIVSLSAALLSACALGVPFI
jgi:hypothetical protein|tara:strand:+ start:833 stop:970 length:138 start_codon:yes stop_codon:yes gene_type:complete